jgi:GTP-binding protein Era
MQGESLPSLQDAALDPSQGFRAGYVAVVGRPNVGKSTLINRLVGQKISIVSEKPQTTRIRLLGILTTETAQIIFIDTPGIHKPHHRLGEAMVRAAVGSLQDADLVAFLVDASVPPTGEDEMAAAALKQHAPALPRLLVLNKIDLISDEEAHQAEAQYAALDGFSEAIRVSATRGDNLDRLLDMLTSRLPFSPPFYPPDQVTDQLERAIAAELVREQVLAHTRQEIPHAVAVVVDEYKERSEEMTYISATIYVERESQKGILIGAGGRMLKAIGQAARQELEAMAGTRVYLDLKVKVRQNWRKKDPKLGLQMQV